MHVDHLLIQQIALQQKQPFRPVDRSPVRRIRRRPHAAIDRGDRLQGQHPVAGSSSSRSAPKSGCGLPGAPSATSRTRPQARPAASRTGAPNSSVSASAVIPARILNPRARNPDARRSYFLYGTVSASRRLQLMPWDATPLHHAALTITGTKGKLPDSLNRTLLFLHPRAGR